MTIGRVERVAISQTHALVLRDRLVREGEDYLLQQVDALLDDERWLTGRGEREVVASTTFEAELVAYVRHHGVPHRML